MVQTSILYLQSRILLSVLSFRLNQRYVEGNPPFIAIDIDVSDSAREGCVVSTLTITSEPKDWRGAVQVCPAFRAVSKKAGVMACMWDHPLCNDGWTIT